MIAELVEPRTLLDELTDAYAVGDAPLGEHLLLEALDQGLPWDEVATAAARGMALRYGAGIRVELERV